MKQVGGLPEVDENLYAFAMHHFFGTRRMVKTPKITTLMSKDTRKLQVVATFPDGSEPQKNELWVSLDRHPDYSMQMEYDAWSPVPMTKTGAATYQAEFMVPAGAKTVHYETVHAHEEAGSTLTLSSVEMMRSVE